MTWNNTNFPLPNGSKNLRVIAATIAQKKLSEHQLNSIQTAQIAHLLHMTFAGKKYETSSRLNKTPPMGAPKATATPAAHAALRTSRLLAVYNCEKRGTAHICENLPSLVSYLPKNLPDGQLKGSRRVRRTSLTC